MVLWVLWGMHLGGTAHLFFQKDFDPWYGVVSHVGFGVFSSLLYTGNYYQTIKEIKKRRTRLRLFWGSTLALFVLCRGLEVNYPWVMWIPIVIWIATIVFIVANIFSLCRWLRDTAAKETLGFCIGKLTQDALLMTYCYTRRDWTMVYSLIPGVCMVMYVVVRVVTRKLGELRERRRDRFYARPGWRW
jgi:hypothetical protein